MLLPGSKFKERLLQGNISKLEEHLFTFLISLLCMIVYVASDVFLPSLPEMISYYKISIALGQMVLSVFMIGLASTQILHGVLADRFGKKNILRLLRSRFERR